MKIIFFGFFACLTISLNVQANEFIQVYTSKAGLHWSFKLRGIYSNGCEGPYNCSKTIKTGKDSPGQAACEMVNARLPTAAEFHELIQNFDSEYHASVPGYVLTKVGKEQMDKVFGGIIEDRFLTSTVIKNEPSVAIIFDATPDSGTFGYLDPRGEPRDQKRTVLCVR